METESTKSNEKSRITWKFGTRNERSYDNVVEEPIGVIGEMKDRWHKRRKKEELDEGIDG